jgi:Mn2+/Fe2+ NRAMP family transporter
VLAFALGLVDTGMLAVPVLASAYATAEGAKWSSASLKAKPHRARKFYAAMAVAVAVGIALDLAGFNAVKNALLVGNAEWLLAPPLVIMVVLLTSDRKVMGTRVIR